MTSKPEMIEISSVEVKKEKQKAKQISKSNTITIYDSVMETLKEKVSVITIRPSTLHLVLKYVMEEIEDTQVTGVEQKELALKLIRALVIDFTEGEDEEVLIKLLNDGTVGNMIDLIVDATKGKININAVSTVGAGFFNHCVPFLCSKKPKK